MALIPLLFLLWLHRQGEKRGQEWWWLAFAFLVSWLADTAAHWLDPDLVGNLYPVSQAAIIGAVLLFRREAFLFLAVLVGTALLVVWPGASGIDVFLRTVAWGAVVALVYDYHALGRLRTSLLVYFGAGLLAWWGYALWPGWPSWLAYQGTRLSGLLLFCWAASHPAPQLRVVRVRSLSEWRKDG